MDATAPTSEVSDHASGLVSLPSTLLSGAVVLLLAGALALAPVRGISLGELTIAGPSGAGDAAATTSDDTADDGLRVAVRGPLRLVPGHPAPLEVRVNDRGGPLQLDARRLQLTVDLELTPAARGWVVVTPRRLLVHPAELAAHRIQLTGFGELPCAEEVGTLTVTARELVEDGRTASSQLTVPGAACDREVPDAPSSVHQREPEPSSGPSRTRAPADEDDDETEEVDEETEPADEDPAPHEGDQQAPEDLADIDATPLDDRRDQQEDDDVDAGGEDAGGGAGDDGGDDGDVGDGGGADPDTDDADDTDAGDADDADAGGDDA